MTLRRLTRSATTAAAVAALMAGPAPFAGASIEEVVLPVRTLKAVNPCTGKEHDVTIAQTRWSHTVDLADPDRIHVNARLTGTITTSDFYSGTIAEVGIDNIASPGGEETGAFSSAVFGIARDDEGNALAVHALFHVTLVDGEEIVVVDKFRLQCLGSSIGGTP